MHNTATAGTLSQAKYEEAICTSAKRAMADAGLTYEQLAEALGQSLHTVWNWFNGRASFPAKALPAMAELGLDAPSRKAADLSRLDVSPQVKFLRNPKVAKKPVRACALGIYSAMGVMATTLEDALKDDAIDARDREAIGADLFKVKKMIAEFEARIQGSGR